MVDNGTRSSGSTHVKLIPHSSGSTVSEQLIPNPGTTQSQIGSSRVLIAFSGIRIKTNSLHGMPDHLNSQFMMRAQRRGRAFHGVMYRMQFYFKEFLKGAHLGI